MIHSVHGLQPTVHGPVGDCLSFFGAGLQPLNWQLWSGNCGLATVDSQPWTANWSLVPFHFWSVVFFVFGCIVGSFLNVCIHRMPLGQSIVSPPSHCPHCKYSIPWYLNIPLVTWLYAARQMRELRRADFAAYFLVELLTGVAFLGCWLAFGNQSAWPARWSMPFFSRA